MMRAGIGFAGVAWAATVLTGCASGYLPVDEAGRTTAAPPSLPTSAGVDVAPAPDTCGAAKLQYLVGKPKAQVPVPVDLYRQRVDCTTCVMSHRDDPRRVTILFDQTTGLVTKVMCQ